MFLPLLLGTGVFAHFLALFRMERSGRQFEFMDEITARHIPMIDSMHAHLGYAFCYAVVFLGVLLWLERRAAPRSAIWITFVLFSVPTLDYAWACFALGTRFAIYNP